MCLNGLETIPQPLSVEKLSSTKPAPGARKVGDRWARQLLMSQVTRFREGQRFQPGAASSIDGCVGGVLLLQH